MKNLRQICRIALCCLAVTSVSAGEIRGTVRDTTGGVANIITGSELLPNVGDKVEIFFKIPGSDDEVSVGFGRVREITADSIAVNIETTTGTVAKSQLARITSANPVKRPLAPPVPITPVTPLPGTPAVTSPTPESPVIRVDKIPPNLISTKPPATNLPETPMLGTATGTSVTRETPTKHVNIVPPGLIPAQPGAGAGSTSAGEHVAQGLANFNAGDMDGAIAHYNEAIRLLPNSGVPYYNRACAYLRKGNYDGVIADSDKALTLGLANPADAFVMRGTARYSKGDVDGAISDCDRAIKINPNHALAYNNRANDRIFKRDWKGALADSNKAVSLDPNMALAYYNRGYVRANMGDHNGAISDWNRAIQLQPGYQVELGRQIEISRSKRVRR